MVVHVCGGKDSSYCGNYTLKRTEELVLTTLMQKQMKNILKSLYLDDFLKSAFWEDRINW